MEHMQAPSCLFRQPQYPFGGSARGFDITPDGMAFGMTAFGLTLARDQPVLVF